jgi:YD repeat-containing protein
VGNTAYTVQNAFDDAGNTLTQTYPNGDVITDGYTAEGWLSSVTLTQGTTSTTLLANADYQGPGGATQHVTSAQIGNGVYSSSAAFDLLLRPTDIKLTRALHASVQFEQARTFDAAGNVSTASTTMQGATDNQAFCYDELDRLTWR